MDTGFDTLLSIGAFDPASAGSGAEGSRAYPGYINADGFRGAMRRVPGAVTVLCTRDGDQRFGLTVTAVSSLSAMPPQLLACVNQGSAFLPAVRRTRRLSINYLSADQVDVSQAFAMPTDTPERRFETGRWTQGASGMPMLADAVVSFDCELVEAMPRASHTILIARIVGAVPGEGKPLLYHGGQYARLAEALPGEGGQTQ